MSVKSPICPYCGRPSVLVDSAEVYRRSHGPIWICRPCKAWVGVHQNDDKNRPLGRLANAELRSAKRGAHAAFDPLWTRKMERDGCSKGAARKAAYSWLSQQLGISFNDCHIGHFDISDCARVVEVCEPYNRALAKVS